MRKLFVALLGVGVPFLVGGIWLINEAQGITAGDDATPVFLLGIFAVGIGSYLCLWAAVESFFLSCALPGLYPGG